MRWNHQSLKPIPGTFNQKDAGVDVLYQDPMFVNAMGIAGGRGILSYALERNAIKDDVLKLHYLDILEGNLMVSHTPFVYARLYFCDTEQDIWDIVKDSQASVESFLYTYAGFRTDEHHIVHTASEERLEQFCSYLETDIPDIRQRKEFLLLSKSICNPEDCFIIFQEKL